MASENCIFCKIAAGDIPAKRLWEDGSHIAFLDIRPASKGHALVIPKEHSESFLDMTKDSEKELFGAVQEVGKKLKESFGAEKIFVLLMGEEVPHTHVHLIPYYGKMPLSLNHEEGLDLDKILEEFGNTEE
ncbi:TPA: HIT domain-containing protein [archaeon]|uniref:HIT domain-containing protein n=1 Tax=Candidatus Undinarchaeum marinum TaxID=2756141 RepID=A0A832UM95_9ARCH|nr:HIT domain-containing protein [Candidatus Undinarchaeum marinum]